MTNIVEAKEGLQIMQATDQEVLKSLAYVATLVGIKDLPDKVAKSVLLTSLRRNYETVTCEELVLAFELAVTGKIQANIEHFNNLDFKYISGVLNAFKFYKAQFLQYNQEDVQALPEMTEESKKEKTVEAMNYFLERYKQDKNTFIPAMVYVRFLNDNGIGLIPSGKTWKDYLEEGKKVLEAEKKRLRDGFKRIELREFEGKASAKTEAARILLKEYFDKLITENKKVEL